MPAANSVNAPLLLIIASLAASALPARAETAPDPLRPAMERAMAQVQPALVRIQAVWTEYHQGREIKREVSGSGFIISKKGHVVTNHHVAGRATRLVCILSNNEEIQATLVGTDPLSDIAVLKLDSAGEREFPAAEWGDSSAVTVGDTVLAMGSPLALSQSVTRGMISNTKMVVPSLFRRFGWFELDGEDVGSLVRWLAHDAPIYPGNSGGPLVDLQGRVIGVNEIRLGLGGAIPSNLARDVAAQIIAHGKVTRSWLGIEIQPLLKDGAHTRGVLISSVIEDSPAGLAGFKSGDILLRIAGQDVTARFDEEIPLLNQMISALPVGQEFDAVVWRDGQQLKLRVRTAERERAESKTHELKQWGLTVRNISARAAREMKLHDRNGVLVTSVRPGGPCGDAKPAIEPGDILRTVAGKPVGKVEDLIALTAELTKDQNSPTPVAVQFDRKTEKLLTIVKVGLKELDDPGLEARKAWLPVAVQVITREMAEQLGAPHLTGVRITQVYSNTTAAAAGLKVGDLLIGLDGERIPAWQPGDEEAFTSRIRQYRVGDKPEFKILRDGQPLTLAVELERSPKLEREMKKFQDAHFEFTARDLCFFDRVREQWPEDLPGALVTEVKEGGWAALGELAVHDVIQAVNAEPVTDVVALERQMKAIAKQRPKYVTLRVLRGIHTRFIELEPNWTDTE